MRPSGMVDADWESVGGMLDLPMDTHCDAAIFGKFNNHPILLIHAMFAILAASLKACSHLRLAFFLVAFHYLKSSVFF